MHVPAAGLLEWCTHGIDDIPERIARAERLESGVVGGARNLLGPFRVRMHVADGDGDLMLSFLHPGVGEDLGENDRGLRPRRRSHRAGWHADDDQRPQPVVSLL
jgi:hypothetical protein